ncbi:MAG: DNA polymerase III subunit beta [Clostridia bacterium]|nr:DNA polymerase III subunit beta [Clostridium sp.]MBS6253069.1 DNA polymerase III subunit beta [Clostridium sp.]
MKIVCYKDKIIKAINSVVKGVASKTTMPILEGILIQTNDNEIKLTTYDLEIGIEYIMECDVEEQGSTVVNAIMFSEIIRKLPDTEIHISVNENNLLEIECEGSHYKLATMNPEEFPELPKIEIENSIEIDQNVLKNMIRKTIFATSTEESRPIFTGCLFEIENNKLSLVAVDGFRLALRTIFLTKQTNDFNAVIPGKTLVEVNKILSDSFEPVKIGVSKNQALFEMDNCKIVTRILDGEFLNYKNVIPSNWETRIRVNKNNIQNSFERISLISASSMEKEKKYPVKVQVDIGKVVISCTNQTGDAKEELFVSTEGKNLEAGFNPKYFLDALKAIEDEDVFIEFGSSISPCLVKSVENNDYVYMILPIRLKE